MRTALGSGHGVDLVDHDVLDRAKDLPRPRREHEVERLGCRDEDVRWVAHDVAPVALGRVTGARGRAQRRHLTEEEQRLAELRGQGCTWPEIAARLGGNPQARRRQLTRALDRVTQHLGLEEVSDA